MVPTPNCDDKTGLQKTVYNLIYPGILGSMLFDLVPMNKDLSIHIYIIQLVIASYYVLDYVHLYVFMDKQFSIDQKKRPTYVWLDLLVCIALYFAFKMIKINLQLSLFLFSVTPLLFLGYALDLSFNIKYYWKYSLFSIFFGGAILVISCKIPYTLLELYILCFILFSFFIYLIYVIVQHNIFEKITQNETVQNLFKFLEKILSIDKNLESRRSENK